MTKIIPLNPKRWLGTAIIVGGLVLIALQVFPLAATIQHNALMIEFVNYGISGGFGSSLNGNLAQPLANQSNELSTCLSFNRETTLMIRCFYYQGDWEQVIRLRQKLLSVNELQAFYIGQALRGIGETDKALQLLRAYPQIARELTFECTSSLNTNKCESALEACTMATEVNPDLGIAYAELGRVNTYCFRSFDEAMNAYNRAIELNGADSNMWLAMAHTMDMQGLPVQAAGIIEHHNLSGPLADAILGNSFRVQGRLVDALKMYQRAVSQTDNNPDFYNVLAEIYLGLGDKQNAAIAWRRVLEINPSYQPALLGLRSLKPK